MTDSAITVMIADDHAVVRHGLRMLLESAPGITVVGEARDGLEVEALVADLDPDVLILDIVMPGLDGLSVTSQVRARFPRTRILVLSMHDSEEYMLEALRRGAVGYVAKGAASASLVDAVRAVANGHRYLRPPIPEARVQDYLRRRGRRVTPKDMLSVRERQVLHLVGEGLSSAAAAVRLGISARTVEAHRARIAEKLGLHGHGDLIRYALSRGIVSPPGHPGQARTRPGASRRQPEGGGGGVRRRRRRVVP